MPGHRQSALLLHGLADTDQRWILASLAAEDQRILGEHLAELKSLGIPADPALVDATAGSSSASDASKSPRRQAASDPLQSASATQMHAMLANEPVWLVRQVLTLEDWSWRQDYLAALTPGQRERLGVTGEMPVAAGGKLAESLRAQLSRRLTGFNIDHAAARPAQARRGLLSSLQQAVRRWL